MRLGWRLSLFLSAITCLLSGNACQKAPPQPVPDSPPAYPVSNTAPAPVFPWQAIEIHRAAQEMALDGFQYGKNTLGWPFEIGAVSSQAYLSKLIYENFLPPEAVKWFDQGWQIANLSDADLGETAFLKVTQPDKSIVIIQKDGQWAVFEDEARAASSVKAPSREPAWLP